METWQRKHINRNMGTLVTETRNLDLLIRLLIGEDILTAADKITIEAKSNAMEKVAEFYDTLMTRVNAYEKFIRVLRDQNQAGAAKILEAGYTEAGVPFPFIVEANNLSGGASSGQHQQQHPGAAAGGNMIPPSPQNNTVTVTTPLVITNAQVNPLANLVVQNEHAVEEWMTVVDALGIGGAKRISIKKSLGSDTREAVRTSLLAYLSKQVEKPSLEAFLSILNECELHDLSGEIEAKKSVIWK